MIKLNHYQYREEYTYCMLQALKGSKKDAFRTDFLELHPTDQADIFTEMDRTCRMRIYDYLNPAEFGAIFCELAPKKQKECMLELARPYAIQMLNGLPSDDATDFIGLLSYQEADFYLDHMEKEEAEDIKQLLAYQEGTAGSLMTTEVIRIRMTDTITEVLDWMRRCLTNVETIYYLYVTDDRDTLLGVVSIRDFLISLPERPVYEMMNPHLVTIEPDAPQADVLEIIKKYGLLAVPVVTEDSRLVGIVTFDDVMSHL